MSVLAIDIGNSRVGAAFFTDGKTADPAARIEIGAIDAELPPLLEKLWQAAKQGREESTPSPGAAIASVVPSLTPRVARMVQQICGLMPEQVGVDLDIPLPNRLTDESTVGVDRLLGALCAYVNTEQACAIISAGSALVVDCIDGEGVFLGGAISPGLAMGAKALNAWAAQLPPATLEPPTGPIGRNTIEALNLGLYAAARGAVRELVERYANKLGAWPHVVATGGDARRLLGETGLVDSFIPDLVLQGVALVWEHHSRSPRRRDRTV